MKKLFAIVLTLALVLALGTTVFATVDETLDAAGSVNTNVTATVTNTPVGDTYCVDVTWGSLAFAYGSTTTWDAEQHKEVTEAGWALTDSYQTVATVDNHSNIAVTASIGFEEADGTNYTAAFQAASQNLAAATEQGGATTASFAMRVGGTGASGAAPANNAVLGTITITLAKQA